METAETTERVLRLDGGRNFRDLGGYETRDGRRLKWGRLYRSGSMAALSPADFARLEALGVRFVCDLRTTYERDAAPMEWRRLANLAYYARDYDASFGDLRTLLASDGPKPEQARSAMLTVYRELPFEQAPAYAELFRRLAAQETPLIFNCSAGKDRTGAAAALILSALDVPEETIVEDYLLSNIHYDPTKSMAHEKLSALGPELTAAVLGVDASYIATALEAVAQAHGTTEAYLRDRLSVGPGELAAIREHLLD